MSGCGVDVLVAKCPTIIWMSRCHPGDGWRHSMMDYNEDTEMLVTGHLSQIRAHQSLHPALSNVQLSHKHDYQKNFSIF